MIAAVLEREQGLKDLFGQDLYRAYRAGRVSRSEAEEVLKLRPSAS